jgi:starvation-inducible outer membrane lipoprotein
MNNVKRLRAAILAIALTPLAACSSIPNPIEGIGNLINAPADEAAAPTDGRISILSFEQSLQVDPNVVQTAIG